jgi:putative PIN family toxin of toxin-antitoxin system
MNDLAAERRLVLDTNILVAAAWARRSASRRIVQRVADGQWTLVVSDAVLGEYQLILQRAVRRADYLPVIQRVVERAERCPAPPPGRWVLEDPEDDKFVAAAVAGRVDALLSNDHHVLKIGRVGQVRIMRPTQFLYAEETGS